MPPKARSVATIEQFSHRTIVTHGAEAYAEVGMAVMSLARASALRERHHLAYVNDIATRQPTALWQRHLADGKHAIATSPWGKRSFLMQDYREPTDQNPGFLRMYLYGNDVAVHGLARAYAVIRVRDQASVPSRDELEYMVQSYSKHPTRNRIISSREATGTFIRLIRSVIAPTSDYENP